ncbi:ABC transporter ATP-binding protein [Sinomonas albida]|uniref:ABC transporter ATP-binding protein n=1 Tax=Sinomonas albida TaxID=369942 RepID=UPI003016C624
MTITSESNPPGSRAAARHAVRTRGLRKTYGKGEAKVEALRGIDLDFPAGQFTAIMGPSGSGKSTLMHCLAGLDTADAGTIELGGTELTGLNDKALTQLRRDRVGFVFQAFNLVPTLTARANISLPVALAGGTVDAAWFDSLVTTLGLADRLEHKPHELSGGQQQRVAVARALLTRPAVVFADEPTGNLDSRAGSEVLGMLCRSSREMGQSIIMVTHDPIAASYADRVVLLADGALVGTLDHPTVETVLSALATVEA